MNVTVDLINASTEPELPTLEDFQHWATSTMTALAAHSGTTSQNSGNCELSIRLLDEDESAYLNENFRQKQGPTNILSFPCAEIPIADINLLGDLAICAPVVCQEAKTQHKTATAHWAHITIHGILHLNAFDHENAIDANNMESLEIAILKTLGIANPYH